MRTRARTKDIDQVVSEMKERLQMYGTIEPRSEELDPELPGQGMFPCYEVVCEKIIE